jgi:hypothetical protein
LVAVVISVAAMVVAWKAPQAAAKLAERLRAATARTDGR